MESVFGNASWHGYVVASYLVVFASLLGFAWISFFTCRKAVEALKNEGYLKQ